MLKVVTRDMMLNDIRELAELGHSSKDSGRQLFANIIFPPPYTARWEEKIRRLYLLLTVKESAMDVPTNLEARRRIVFFTNSLFMKMPRAPRVCKMLSFSNPALCVVYIDEVEERLGGKNQKVLYSVLIKAVDNLDQEIYRIKLPGLAKIGEEKPENRNHAIIFTRGETLQTIDVNQVYGLSWLVIVAAMLILKIVSMGRKKFSADFELMFRLLKLILFISFVVTLVILVKFLQLITGDIFFSFLEFLPTG